MGSSSPAVNSSSGRAEFFFADRDDVTKEVCRAWVSWPFSCALRTNTVSGDSAEPALPLREKPQLTRVNEIRTRLVACSRAFILRSREERAIQPRFRLMGRNLVSVL